jgi:hypothetical protein
VNAYAGSPSICFAGRAQCGRIENHSSPDRRQMQIEIATTHFPRLTKWHVQKALKLINPTDLEGLERIRLLDFEPLDPDASTQPPYLVGFLYCGAYSRRKRNRPASISLYTRDLYFGIPKPLALSPLARLRIASALAHEVGHHAITTHKYVCTRAPKVKLNSLIDSENERGPTVYAEEVEEKMFGSRYFRIGRVLGQILSYFLFKVGTKAHFRSDFKRAAELEFRAWILNHENTDAWQSYLQDRQAILSHAPTALSDAERLWIYHRRVVSK